MGKFCQCLTELPAHDTIMAGYYSLTFLLSDVDSASWHSKVLAMAALDHCLLSTSRMAWYFSVAHTVS